MVHMCISSSPGDPLSTKSIPMPAYSRRPLGTALLSVLLLMELVFSSYAVMMSWEELNRSIAKPCLDVFLSRLLIIFTVTSLIGYLIWMLFDPLITAGKGKIKEMRIFLAVIIIVNAILWIPLSEHLDDDFFKNMTLVLIYSHPSIFATMLYFINTTADDSTSCLRLWKPWMIREEKPESAI